MNQKMKLPMKRLKLDHNLKMMTAIMIPYKTRKTTCPMKKKMRRTMMKKQRSPAESK
jgi:hypothetical protein